MRYMLYKHGTEVERLIGDPGIEDIGAAVGRLREGGE